MRGYFGIGVEDISKPHGKAFENLCIVRDASDKKKPLRPGWWCLVIDACTANYHFLPLVRQLFFAQFSNGDDAGVFRHLRGFTGVGFHRLIAGFPPIKAFRIGQIDQSFGQCIRGVALGAGRARNSDGITSFLKL